MPIYKNEKLLGITYEGKLFYPRLGIWKVVTYYTALAEDYFKEI